MAQRTRQRDPEQIRADIARARAEIESSVLTLKQEVTARADWRQWVQKRPLWAVGGAIAIGLVVGLATRPKPRIAYVIEREVE